MWKLTPAIEASPAVTYGLAGIAVTMALLLVAMVFYGSRRHAPLAAMILAGVMLGEVALADAGILQRWDLRPPPFMLMFVPLTVMTVRLAFSKFAAALAAAMPLSLLVGMQAFRLPLELVMHQAALEGVMPPQLSYTGNNFDFVTGSSALLVGALLALNLAPRALVTLWNLMGLALLVSIVALALGSMPILHLFGPDKLNTWVTYPPFVWLPGLLVQTALFAHLLVWRKLRATAIAGRRAGEAQPASKNA